MEERKCTFPYHSTLRIHSPGGVVDESGGCIGGYVRQECGGSCEWGFVYPSARWWPCHTPESVQWNYCPSTLCTLCMGGTNECRLVGSTSRPVNGLLLSSIVEIELARGLVSSVWESTPSWLQLVQVGAWNWWSAGMSKWQGHSAIGILATWANVQLFATCANMRRYLSSNGKWLIVRARIV